VAASVGVTVYLPFGMASGWTAHNGAVYHRTIDQDGRITGLALPAGGNIELIDIEGAAQIETGGGSIHIGPIKGGVRADLDLVTNVSGMVVTPEKINRLALVSLSQGGTAWFAHVGGFVAGILLVNLLGTRQKYMRRQDLNW
jgi:hypothetical protein